MIASHHLSLEGVYKFFVYNKDGNLKDTIVAPNFITTSGLKYPETIPFADCFRYISIGLGTSVNTTGTTGLANGINSFAYIGGKASEYELTHCGFIEHSSGVTLSRGWRIPAGDTFFTQNYNFKEFMVSPGKPTGSNLSCDEHIDLLTVYPNICNQNKAFSRVLKDVYVQPDEYLVVSYELNISTNTGVNYFQIIPNTNNDYQNESNLYWRGAHSGVFGLMHHGLNLIRGIENANNTNVPNNVFQPLYAYPHNGDSFVGAMGSPMEPSTKIYSFYLSTDNTQFFVSELTGGGMDTGLYKPYNANGKNFPSGNAYYHSQPMNETSAGTSFHNKPWLVNIRKQEGNHFPNKENFRLAGNQDNAGISLNTISADTEGVFYETPPTPSFRKRSKIISCQIRNNSVPGGMMHKPIRSMVLGIKGTNTNNIYPFLDLVFADKFAGIRPPFSTENKTFEVENNYSKLDGENNITFQYRIYWSSPCNGVANCNDPT